MQLIQYDLKARQNRAIEVNRERSLQPRLMRGLSEQTLQFDEVQLQMQLPENKKVNSWPSCVETEED